MTKRTSPPVSRARTDVEQEMPSLFERIGAEKVERLVAAFYTRVDKDPVIRPLYGKTLTCAMRGLTDFMISWLGGPPTYDVARARLRRRHAPFAIDTRARDAWLANMKVAVQEVGIRAAEARRRASTITSNSIKVSFVGGHVGCMTNTSRPRAFSINSTRHSPSLNLPTSASPSRVCRCRAISCARAGFALPANNASVSEVVMSLASDAAPAGTKKTGANDTRSPTARLDDRRGHGRLGYCSNQQAHNPL